MCVNITLPDAGGLCRPRRARPSNMSLTDAQLGEFKEAFEIFDKEKTGSLTSEQLGAVLRSVGTNPTDEEVEEIASQVQKGGKVDLECVIEAGKIMAGKMAGKNLESECLDAFKVFDENGDGTMPSGCVHPIY